LAVAYFLGHPADLRVCVNKHVNDSISK